MEFNKIEEESRNICPAEDNEIDKLFSQKCFCIAGGSNPEKLYEKILSNKIKWSVLYGKNEVYFILYTDNTSLFNEYERIERDFLKGKSLSRNPTPSSLAMMKARSFVNENFI